MSVCRHTHRNQPSLLVSGRFFSFPGYTTPHPRLARLAFPWRRLERLYITPQDFSLRTTPSGTSPPRLPGEAPSPPRVIRDDTRCRVWHKTDQTYMTPKLNLYARMTSPVVYESPESMVSVGPYTFALVRFLSVALSLFLYEFLPSCNTGNTTSHDI